MHRIEMMLRFTAVQKHLDCAVKEQSYGQITTALAIMNHASFIANNGEQPDSTCPYCE